MNLLSLLGLLLIIMAISLVPNEFRLPRDSEEWFGMIFGILGLALMIMNIGNC